MSFPTLTMRVPPTGDPKLSKRLTKRLAKAYFEIEADAENDKWTSNMFAVAMVRLLDEMYVSDSQYSKIKTDLERELASVKSFHSQLVQNLKNKKENKVMLNERDFAMEAVAVVDRLEARVCSLLNVKKRTA